MICLWSYEAEYHTWSQGLFLYEVHLSCADSALPSCHPNWYWSNRSAVCRGSLPHSKLFWTIAFSSVNSCTGQGVWMLFVVLTKGMMVLFESLMEIMLSFSHRLELLGCIRQVTDSQQRLSLCHFSYLTFLFLQMHQQQLKIYFSQAWRTSTCLPCNLLGLRIQM